MQARARGGTTLARAFRMPDAPRLSARTLHKSALTFTELRGDLPNHGMTASIAYDDAYLIALQLRACPDHDLFFEGNHVTPKNFRAGMTSIYDLKQDPRADLRSTFHSIHFHLPRRVLNSYADEVFAPHIEELRYQQGVSVSDPVVRDLISSLRPALANPEAASVLFVDHVALALIAHVAHTYGGIAVGERPVRGGLAAWQERRAKELMRENLHGEMTLERLARECGLSASHFARAFRRSTGMPPHRWLQKCRLDLARQLLRNPTLSLTNVALNCGFSDQSHFTRVFTAAFGVSPGVWRRSQP